VFIKLAKKKKKTNRGQTKRNWIADSNKTLSDLEDQAGMCLQAFYHHFRRRFILKRAHSDKPSQKKVKLKNQKKKTKPERKQAKMQQWNAATKSQKTCPQLATNLNIYPYIIPASGTVLCACVANGGRGSKWMPPQNLPPKLVKLGEA